MQIFRVNDGRDETMAREARPLVCAWETRDYRGMSLKPVIRYPNEKAPRHFFCVLKQIYDLISTDASRHDVYLLIYVYFILWIRCRGFLIAVRHRKVRSVRKEKEKKNERRKRERRGRCFSQSSDLNETLSASNLFLDENNCTVGELAGAGRKPRGVLYTIIQDVPRVQHRRKKKIKRVRRKLLYNPICSIYIHHHFQYIKLHFTRLRSVRFMMSGLMMITIMLYDAGLVE